MVWKKGLLSSEVVDMAVVWIVMYGNREDAGESDLMGTTMDLG
jgi:hypothetical protein